MCVHMRRRVFVEARVKTCYFCFVPFTVIQTQVFSIINDTRQQRWYSNDSVTYFAGINTMWCPIKSLLGAQSVPATMRIFVCLLSALALCQGNQLGTAHRPVFTLTATNAKLSKVPAFSDDKSTSRRPINAHLTKKIRGNETVSVSKSQL